jgi:hypothetical protein
MFHAAEIRRSSSASSLKGKFFWNPKAGATK